MNHHRAISATLVLLCGFANCGIGSPPALVLRSEPTQAALLELFTSEGCSSCPPADQWFGELKRSPGLWRNFVPVAFHVDYWNSLGWSDRFARAEFSARQYRYARLGNIPQVYTPAVLLRGTEWRDWSPSTAIPATSALRVGILQLQVAPANAVTVQWRPIARPATDPVAEVALLGFELRTPVRAGENSGRELQHDFVVLALQRLQLRWSGDHYEGAFTMPAARASAPRHALAAWVATATDPTPLQAVGGWWPAQLSGP